MIRLTTLILSLAGLLGAAPLDLRLPTENHHLFTGELDQFYMYVNRNFEGQTTKEWQAGCYGMVRSPIRVGDQIVLTKFHEGIDIAPMKRDTAGNPLDVVSSIAAGRVVHTSPVAGRSNYGKYVVVEHTWENSSVYSIYAHLSQITCQPGDTVEAGSTLGQMGFTGAGIDRARAHCHVELGLLLSARYEDWNKKSGGGVNFHGIYNGINIIGAEISRFFLEQKANPELQFSQFVTATPVYFIVTVPSHGIPDFVKRYPWITHGSPDAAVSWEISFSATGLPVAFNPSTREVAAPVVTSIRPSTIPQRYLTRGLVIGEGNQASLTTAGKNLVALLTDDFPTAPTNTRPPHDDP